MQTPVHVCMAVVEPSVSVADIGRLVAWSMAMGVSEVRKERNKTESLFAEKESISGRPVLY